MEEAKEQILKVQEKEGANTKEAVLSTKGGRSRPLGFDGTAVVRVGGGKGGTVDGMVPEARRQVIWWFYFNAT